MLRIGTSDVEMGADLNMYDSVGLTGYKIKWSSGWNIYDNSGTLTFNDGSSDYLTIDSSLATFGVSIDIGSNTLAWSSGWNIRDDVGNLTFNDGSSDTVTFGSNGLITCGELAAASGSLSVDGTGVGFYGSSTTSQASALTTALTQITQAGTFTPDYAIQAVTNTSPYGFATADEAETLVSIILNLQTRVDELESKLQAYGLLA